MVKGWIALDIDGTITNDIHSVPVSVITYLGSLVDQGWQIIFLTGRMFSFAKNTLKDLSFPYYLALQNGADILQMPEKKVISQNYLKVGGVVPLLDRAYREEKEDYLIYSGYERGDFCYFRPSRFSFEMEPYLRKIEKLGAAPWQAVEEFSFSEEALVSLIKCLGSKEMMEKIEGELKSLPSIATAVIRDPLSEDLYLILITNADATKGRALKKIAKSGIVIAAGDDLNDLSMLQVADIRIAMENAPERLHKEADIIAAPASQEGIIDALKQALGKI